MAKSHDQISLRTYKQAYIYYFGDPNFKLGPSPLTIERITEIVAAHTGFSVKKLREKGRPRESHRARAIATYLVNKHTNLTMQHIASYFGNKSHAFVHYTKGFVNDLMKSDEQFKNLIGRIEVYLGVEDV